jgi:hypothetical protein
VNQPAKAAQFRPNMPDQWAKDWTLSLQNWSKNELFRRFSETKSYDAGEFGGEKFFTGVDFKRVKNNLQGFKGNLYPSGV